MMMDEAEEEDTNVLRGEDITRKQSISRHDPMQTKHAIHFAPMYYLYIHFKFRHDSYMQKKIYWQNAYSTSAVVQFVPVYILG